MVVVCLARTHERCHAHVVRNPSASMIRCAFALAGVAAQVCYALSQTCQGLAGWQPATLARPTCISEANKGI